MMILELAIITLAYAARLTEAATVAPLSIPSSTSYYSWYGKDGNWSAVTISVGTPPQRVQLIPSTDGTELWAVLPLSCQNADKPLSECRQSRGGLFDESKSSSWEEVGYYDVFSDQRAQAQGLSLSGLYGTDNIRITDSITLEDHLLSGFMNDSLYDAGVFGLGPENTTFNGDIEYPSLVGSLFSMGKIPSLSWSFTAGAFYREKKVYCQVLLGGYDLKRFEPHGVSFSLTPELKPLASLQKITLESGVENTEVVEDAVDVYIDSTTPYLWLPTAVCDSIAEKLGLKWDDKAQLYFYNDDAAYNSASNANYTFTFTLKNSTEVSNDEVKLDLPFEAFDLWHHNDDGSASRYFPLKRATESIQYTLGRAFLQETYLIVDFNRVNYTIAQAKFDGNTGSTQDIHPISDILLELGPNGQPTGLVAQGPGATEAAIPRSSGGGGSGNSAPHGRKLAGIIAGSVIGGLILLALFIAAIFLLLRRRRKRRLREELNKAAPSFPSEGVAYSIRHSTGPNTAITPNSPIEIGETSPKVELPAAPVPPSYLAPQELDGLEKQELDATGENYDRGSMIGQEGTAVAADSALAEKLAMEKSAESEAEAQAELELAAKKALPVDLVKQEDEDEIMEEYDTERDAHREADEDERRWLRASAEGSSETKGIDEVAGGITRPPRSRNGKSSTSSGNLLDNPFFRLNMKQ